MKFTKEDVQKLIESINVGNINESEMDVLATDTMNKLNESFQSAYDAGKADGIKESTENIRKERLESYQRGQEKGKESLNEAIAKAEELAFKAGHDKAIQEAEAEDEEVSKEILDRVEQLCEIFDKYTRLVELVTYEDSKEEFKESVKDALIKFCDKRVNESLPEKTIVNYHRLQQLEALNESIKKMYLINDIDVSEAVKEAKESCAKEFNEAKEMAADQTKRRIAAEQMLESVKAENFLLKRVQNLPLSDQKELLESFKGASMEAINESFDREYQKITARHAAIAQKAHVNDVICESRLQKLREAHAKKIEESAKKEAEAEKVEAEKQINESVEHKAKKEMDSRMNQYASMCKTLQRNGL